MEDNKRILILKSNGYFHNSTTCILDDKTFMYPLTLKEYNAYIHHPLYETKWEGNNPFVTSEVYQYWIDGVSRIEVFFDEYDKCVGIYKVLGTTYSTSGQLLQTLGLLDEVYQIVRDMIENQIEDLQVEDDKLNTREMEE